MVSQSRLYFALLASVATMAFWMGMWRYVLSGYLDNYQDTLISRPFLLSKYPDPKIIEITKYPDTKKILGMWSSTVSQNSKFTNPKPYRVILYYSGVENSSQISSGGKKKLFCFLCAFFTTWLHEFLIPQSPIYPSFLDQSEFLFDLTLNNNKEGNKACSDWPKKFEIIWDSDLGIRKTLQLILYQYFVL